MLNVKWGRRNTTTILEQWMGFIPAKGSMMLQRSIGWMRIDELERNDSCATLLLSITTHSPATTLLSDSMFVQVLRRTLKGTRRIPILIRKSMLANNNLQSNFREKNRYPDCQLFMKDE